MFRIIPRDQEFFVLFQKASANIVEGRSGSRISSRISTTCGSGYGRSRRWSTRGIPSPTRSSGS